MRTKGPLNDPLKSVSQYLGETLLGIDHSPSIHAQIVEEIDLNAEAIDLRLKKQLDSHMKLVELQKMQILELQKLCESQQEQITGFAKEVRQQKVMIHELSSTNDHLISATWREREIKKELEQTLLELSKEQEIKRQLTESLEELEKSKQELFSKSRAIQESISYSKKIQASLNPSNDEIRKHFNDSFIWHQAKDVISGDFPWVYTEDDFMYVAAVDCTGHGVPGAMLAIIGSLLIKKIVGGNENKSPSQILDELNQEVFDTLRQERHENAHEGMDLGLVKINIKTFEAEFAGAHRPLYHVNKGKLNKVKADRCGIGGEMHHKVKSFTNHSIKLAKGDTIYLFSDGLTDQFGGKKDKKMGSKAFQEIITYYPDNARMDIIEDDIVEQFKNWKGEGEQTDDVLVIGIKI